MPLTFDHIASSGPNMRSKSLHFLEDALCDYHFYRVHKSYIVNLNKVQRYSKTDGGILVMENGDLVKVSRSKKDELLNIL